MLKNSFNVPAFLTKLWDMVNDPKTDDLICWSPVSKFNRKYLNIRSK